MNTVLRKHYIHLLAATIVLVLAVIALWIFGLLMETKENKVISAKEQLASYEQNKIIYAEESAKFKAITARTEALEQYLITEETIPNLLSSLESVAASNKISFSITGVQTPGEGEKEKLLIDFSGKGSFAAIQNFLTSLARQSYEVKITKLSLSQQAVRAPVTTPAPVVPTEGVEGEEQSAAPVAAPEKFEWQLYASIEVISF